MTVGIGTGRMRRIIAWALITLMTAIAFATLILALITVASAFAHAEPAMGHPIERTPDRGPGWAQNPYREPDVDQMTIDVDKGIRFVLEASPCWGLAANDEARRAMAKMIADASRAHEVPPLLLTVMAKRESSFATDAIGQSRGEVGLLQVHGLAARGCDLSTAEGQLACGARWLRLAYDKCGTWESAITAYAAGYCHAQKDTRLDKLVLSRYRQWQRTLAVIEGCNSGHTDHWVCQRRRETCVDAIRVIARARTGKNGRNAWMPRIQTP
jgi:hypothetical protein